MNSSAIIVFFVTAAVLLQLLPSLLCFTCSALSISHTCPMFLISCTCASFRISVAIYVADSTDLLPDARMLGQHFSVMCFGHRGSCATFTWSPEFNPACAWPFLVLRLPYPSACLTLRLKEVFNLLNCIAPGSFTPAWQFFCFSNPKPVIWEHGSMKLNDGIYFAQEKA